MQWNSDSILCVIIKGRNRTQKHIFPSRGEMTRSMLFSLVSMLVLSGAKLWWSAYGHNVCLFACCALMGFPANRGTAMSCNAKPSSCHLHTGATAAIADTAAAMPRKLMQVNVSQWGRKQPPLLDQAMLMLTIMQHVCSCQWCAAGPIHALQRYRCVLTNLLPWYVFLLTCAGTCSSWPVRKCACCSHASSLRAAGLRWPLPVCSRCVPDVSMQASTPWRSAWRGEGGMIQIWKWEGEKRKSAVKHSARAAHFVRKFK